jgi:cardiolipin synthase
MGAGDQQDWGVSIHGDDCGQDKLAQMDERADQAFSRAAGAPLISGNHVRLLKDAGE